MSGPFHSPAPWQVNANGGARTIVARDRSVVAVIVGSNGAAPFEVGNGALMAASPDLRLQLTGAVALLRETEWHSDGGSGLWCNHCKGGARGGQREPTHERGCPLAAFFTKGHAALAKAEGR